ncbi:MAG: hypothetical protein NXI04_09700 [Planctomycetaceae bacterium]|nr:hypothetical protein [Planctomycetaceae bacterium]
MSSTESSAETFQPTVGSLVQYVELWLLSEDESSLECRASASVGAGVRGADGRSVSSGEGLAGAAWKQKTATILQETPSDLMASLNAAAAAPAGDLSAFVAIPLFCQQEMRGVVVLGLSDAFGAIEVWSRDDRDELAVTSGHYQGLPSFEFITRYTRFPKGAGLPGMVWKLGVAQLAQNLDTSSGFIRSFGKDPAVITSALGLPVASQRGFPASVLLLLSAQDIPLAGLTELWSCSSTRDDEGSMTAAVDSVDTVGGSMTTTLAGWQREILSRVNSHGQPLLLGADSLSLPAGATFSLSLPIYRQNELCNVLNMMF